MDFIQLVEERYSVRGYCTTAVEKDKLDHMLQAARMAPSAVNMQPVKLYVVQSEPMLSGLKACYAREWMKNVPVIIVACGDHNRGWHRVDGKDHTDVDVAIAIDHLTLAATEMGLGTCWVCNFDAGRCASVLGLPEGVEPVAMVPVGYAAGRDRNEKRRKSIEEIVTYI